ncbi:hypothetical protein FAA86_13665 [Rhizobium rosettiformans W3]|uniref:Uncharacterized protein n=1 Tax=Rhizobium rosettiformans W3 TaxID=538378 RepID=A0A4S8Q2B9_9HYPH|nr:hypothetical protein FAA86_13665 [Rhizobium rosettiformans W3]
MCESGRKWLGRPDPLFVDKLGKLADDSADVQNCCGANARSAAFSSWTSGRRVALCLVGYALGYPSIPDGRAEFSSEVFYLDPDRRIARTMSRWYRLGTHIRPKYWSERFRVTSFLQEGGL